MTAQERLDYVTQALSVIAPAWACIAAELQERIDSLTEALISEDNEQTRGRIKALRDLLNLPEALQQERDGITAGLSEESDPAL